MPLSDHLPVFASPLQVVQWDLAVEKDSSEGQAAEDSLKVPPQLLFIHQVCALSSPEQPRAVSVTVLCFAVLHAVLNVCRARKKLKRFIGTHKSPVF